MVACTRTDYEDAPPFAALLPHSLLLDPDRGILLLAPPRWGKPSLALGCAWSVIPRNIEVCDESVCVGIARAHEHLLRSLPVGAALQVGMTILPATQAPAWEARRRAVPPSPLLEAQQAVIRQGVPFQDGARQGRLRAIPTWVSLRLPITPVDAEIPMLLQTLLTLPAPRGEALADRLMRAFTATTLRLEGLGSGLEATLTSVGHQVTRLSGASLGALLAQTLDPLGAEPPVIVPEIPLARQILRHYPTKRAGGWTFGEEIPPRAAQVLSLHHAPRQTYPGILSAPRAPEGTEPLALWDAWDGPLSVVVNVAIADHGKEMARLRFKRVMAFLHRLNPFGDTSPEHEVLKEELDTLLKTFFRKGGQLVWARIHLVLWDTTGGLPRTSDAVIRAARRLELEFGLEPHLGSTLFLQTLPLGFDLAWPSEKVVQRERRLPVDQIGNFFPLFGGGQGTKTATILYTNPRGEAVGFDPFDLPTNPHMIIKGKGGAGKSFTMAHIANQVLPLGASMVLLDRLPSYEALCAYWGGSYLAMDFNAPICFNLFYGPFDKGHLAFATASLAQKASGGTEPLNRESLGALSGAVAYAGQTWPATRGELTLTTFVEEVLETGIFSPQDARERRLGREIARKLRMFYGRGPYAGFSDGPNTLVLHPILTVIELSKLRASPDLQSSILFDTMHLLIQFFTAPDKALIPKYFGSDETWANLKYGASEEVMEEIARTFRKLYVCAIFSSQYCKEFASETGRVLLESSPTKILLEHEESEWEALTSLLGLTRPEALLVEKAHKHAEWSSAYLRLPGQAGGLVRLVPDAVTRWQCSQDPAEKRLREETIREMGGEVRPAVDTLAQRYPFGLQGGPHG